jgi:hypothetical protein
MRVEYLTKERPVIPGVALRCGEVGCLYLGADENWVSETRLQLSANSTHALIGHGVIDALNELPIEGQLGGGLQVLIPPSQLEAARRLFYLADARTYGGSHEFVLGTASDPEEDGEARVEFRIRIDIREYQITLSGLQYQFRIASREGAAIWIQI